MKEVDTFCIDKVFHSDRVQITMRHDVLRTQLTETTNEIPWGQGVTFDPDAVSLEGIYRDELSAFRARRAWIDALESNFLLDLEHDFILTTRSNLAESVFSLQCEFVSACGRYAFWRLTNNQAPEAQYLIETAHIPNAELREGEFQGAPDLLERQDPEPMIWNHGEMREEEYQPTLTERISGMLCRLFGL